MLRSWIALIFLTTSISACGAGDASQKSDGNASKSANANASNIRDEQSKNGNTLNSEVFQEPSNVEDGIIYLKCNYKNLPEMQNYKVDIENTSSPKIYAFDSNENKYVESKFLFGSHGNRYFWDDVKNLEIDENQIKMSLSDIGKNSYLAINRSTGSVFESTVGGILEIASCEKSLNMVKEKAF